MNSSSRGGPDLAGGPCGYRTRSAHGLPLCEVHPSTTPGYWWVVKFEFPTEDVIGMHRPVRADGVRYYLRSYAIRDDVTWTSFPTEPARECPWLGQSLRSAVRDREVYLIQPINGGLVKIGSAESATARLDQVQFMSPVPLHVVATIAGGYAVETELHRRFTADRVRGEWFHPSKQLFAAFGVEW